MVNTFIRNERDRQWVTKAQELALRFSKRADEHDRNNTFPFENFQELIEAGFHKLTVPKKWGGDEISLYEFILIQETLATGCASTALGLGWHLGILMNHRETKEWSPERYEEICRHVITGKWLNSCSTEPSTGSPSRGRRHHTTATKTSTGWVINGHKTWSTLSPILDIFLISAAIDGTNELGQFYVPRHTDGLVIDETWDSIGMRATGSHDVLLREVHLPYDALLTSHEYGKPSTTKIDDGDGWLLHIPACYLGIAMAARKFALQFASEYHPGGSEHPIAHFPSVKERIGKMELELFTARTMLYYAARLWDESPDQRGQMRNIFGAAKLKATNIAIEVIDLAMRIVGGRSMFKSYPLERYYRDVRGGLHNPPMDDVVIQRLATAALDEIKSSLNE